VRVSSSQRYIDKDKLAARRTRARLTQAALARRAGLHPTYIQLLERGKRNGSPESLGLIADALGCDITELMPARRPAQDEQPDPAPAEPARVA
jgi:transcriptional regulator with XRE-family HTH domain